MLDVNFVSHSPVKRRGGFVGAPLRRVQVAVEALRPLPNHARPAATADASRRRRRPPHQWLTRVGPAVWVGLLTVVVLQERPQPRSNCSAPAKSPPFRNRRAFAEPQFHLVQPRPDSRRTRGNGERVPDRSKRQGRCAPVRNDRGQEGGSLSIASTSQTCKLQCVFRLSITHVTPASPSFQATCSGGPRSLGGARRPQIHHLPGRDHGPGQSGRVRDGCSPARGCSGCPGHALSSGASARKDLHAGLLVATDDQLSVLVQRRRLDIQGANLLGPLLEVGVMALEPVDTAMGLGRRPRRGCRPDGGAAEASAA